jgi:hypothetical protein
MTHAAEKTHNRMINAGRDVYSLRILPRVDGNLGSDIRKADKTIVPFSNDVSFFKYFIRCVGENNRKRETH